MSETNYDFDEIQIAYMYASGDSQADIAKTIGDVSQSKVSRIINQAYEEGLLIKSKVEFNREMLPEHLKTRFEAKFGVVGDIPELRELSDNFIKVTVLPDDSFHESVALILPDEISEATTIGIGWGQTCRLIAERIPTGRRMQNKGRVIPIQGEPLFYNHKNAAKYSPSRLAVLLENALFPDRNNRLDGDERFSLIGVPAYIGDSTHRGAVEAFYSQLPGYQGIFGPDGLAREMNCFICGVGMLDSEIPERSGVFIRERIAQNSEKEENVRKICAGDYGGLLLPRKKKHNTAIRKLNEGWVGLTEDMLRDVASMRRKKKGPGSIAIARGEHKAEAILAAIEANYISQLIIDSSLAHAIRLLLGER